MKGGSDDTSKCTVQAKHGRNGKVLPIDVFLTFITKFLIHVSYSGLRWRKRNRIEAD